MSAKTEGPKFRRAPATSRGSTASHEQLEGSERADSATRKLEKMPHERDESASGAGDRPDEAVPPIAGEIAQAHEDIEEGLQDTDRRGVPDDIPGSRQNRGR
jgi:hypothetical protein